MEVISYGAHLEVDRVLQGFYNLTRGTEVLLWLLQKTHVKPITVPEASLILKNAVRKYKII